VNAVDLVFPVFVTLSGAGLGYAFARRVSVRTTLRRFVVLLIVGLLYNAIIQYGSTVTFSFATLRLTGVLQLYAVIVLLVALMHLITRSWVGWLLMAVVLAGLYTAGLWYFASTCPGAELTPQCNPSGALDPVVFGRQHLYGSGAAGHDPEGLFTILGALVSASVGASAAHLLIAHRDRPSWGLLRGVVITVGVLGAGVLLTNELTITAKRLWTPPFGLSIALATIVALWLLALLFDYWTRTPKVIGYLTYPLVALGRNSLLVYFGSHILMFLLIVSRPRASELSWAKELTISLSGSADDVVPLILATITFWTLLSMLLHRKRLYLRP
jgi:predicted acyltransferase